MSAAERARVGRVQRPFLQDVVRSFTMFGSLSNLMSLIGCAVFLFAAGALALLPMLGLISLIGQFMVYGIVAAFLMEIVQTTAGGDDELPTTQVWGGVYDGIIVPLVQLIGATTFVMLPTILLTIWMSWTGDASPGRVFLNEFFRWAGLFMWPIAILAVALGGLTALARFDLLVRTVLKTLPAYGVVFALVAIVAAVEGVFSDTLEGDVILTAVTEEPSPLYVVAVIAVLSLVGAWSSIVTMRAIGLYYRHFSHRFPWSAG